MADEAPQPAPGDDPTPPDPTPPDPVPAGALPDGTEADGTGQGELMAKGAMMALGTIISRATGLLRDISMTAALGLGIVADIFTVGNTIPNMVYMLTVGGAMSAIFVPQLVRRMKDDSDGGAGFADRLITLTGVVLIVLTGVSILAAPLLTRLYTSADYTAEQMSLATAFARFCLPQVFFYGLFTLLSQVLNARGRFAPPMYAPIANNVVAIGVFLTFLAVAGPTAVDDGTLDAQQTAFLGLGSTAAVATQALLLVPFLYRTGYHFRPRFDWRGWGLSKTGGLALWTLGLLAANQVSFIVHSRLATTANVLAQEEGLPAAGIATYQKAYLIFFLPHSIVTVSLVTALLPGLSRLAHAREFATMSRVLAETTRTVTALTVPITAILIPVAPLIASVLFGVGAADQQSATVVGYTVIGMLSGLIPFSIYFILLRGWYSLEDTRTPFYYSLALNAIMVTLSLALFQIATTAMKVPALGLAFGMTYWLMMPLAWPALGRRVGGLPSLDTWLAVGRMLAAGAVTVAVAWAAARASGALLAGLGDTRLTQVIDIAAAAVAGMAAYLLLARLMRIGEVDRAVGMVLRRLRR